MEHGTANDQLANQVQDVIDTLGVHAEQIFAGCCDGLSAFFSAGLVALGLLETGGRIWGIGRGCLASCRDFIFFLVGAIVPSAAAQRRQRFQLDSRHDTGNATLLREAGSGFQAGQNGRDPPRRLQVFRLQRSESQDLAGFCQDVADDLQRGFKHRAMGVEVQAHKVNGNSFEPGRFDGASLLLRPVVVLGRRIAWIGCLVLRSAGGGATSGRSGACRDRLGLLALRWLCRHTFW